MSSAISWTNKTQDIQYLLEQDPNKKKKNEKATINASKLVKDICSIYMMKGRMGSTASKLLCTKPKCMRMGR